MSINSFIELLGIEFVQTEEKEQAIGMIKLKDLHSQLYGNAHGGVLYSLADTVAGFLIWKNSTDFDLINTIEMKMNYLAPAPINGTVKAVATLKHLGKTTGVSLIDVFYYQGESSNGKLVATAIATFTRIKKEKGVTSNN